jgi:hypothetical protein
VNVATRIRWSGRWQPATRDIVDFADLLDEPFLALPQGAGPLRDYWLALDASGVCLIAARTASPLLPRAARPPYRKSSFWAERAVVPLRRPVHRAAPVPRAAPGRRQRSGLTVRA